MGYAIVQPDAKTAREAILDLWRRNLPEVPAERNAWLYESGPATGFLLRSGQGLTVGATGLMRRDFRAFGETLRAGQAIDLNVDQEHRTVGPALNLQRTILAAVAGGEIDLAYGFPNRQSEVVIRRIGYGTLGDLDRWVKPLSCRVAFDRWAWPRPLSRGLAAILDPILRCGNAVRDLFRRCVFSSERVLGRKRLLTPFSVQQVDTFDARFDWLWEAAARRWPILGERTSDYLSWRFSRCPDLKHRAMCLSDPGGELLGYVIYGRRGETVYAADFLVGDLRHLEPLLAEFLRLVRRQRAHKVVALYFGRPEVGQALTRLGFWKRPSGRKVMLYVGGKRDEPALDADRGAYANVVAPARIDLAPFSDPANWHLTGADIDTDG